MTKALLTGEQIFFSFEVLDTQAEQACFRGRESCQISVTLPSGSGHLQFSFVLAL